MLKLKGVLTVFLAFSLFGCNQTPKNTDGHDAMENHDEHQHAPATALSLNSGEKWKSDLSTKTHVDNLIDKSNAFNKNTSPDVVAYHAFANDMQTDLNALIKDCKMEGPDHDALHAWLEPVVEDLKVLKNVKTEAEGKKGAEELSESIQKFNEFFESEK